MQLETRAEEDVPEDDYSIQEKFQRLITLADKHSKSPFHKFETGKIVSAKADSDRSQSPNWNYIPKANMVEEEKPKKPKKRKSKSQGKVKSKRKSSTPVKL